MVKKKKGLHISKSTHVADKKRHGKREKDFEEEAKHIAKTGKRIGMYYPAHLEERIKKYKK